MNPVSQWSPPSFKDGNASIRQALNEIVEYARIHGVNPSGRSGWSETPDGWMPPPFSAALEETAKPWDLVIVDAEEGEVSVDCGTIIKRAADLSVAFTISGAASTFTPTSNQWIYLKIVNLSTPTVTLTCGGNWTDYPSAVETTGTGASAIYAAYYYPIHHFRSTTAAGYTKINNSLFFRKLGQDDHFMLIHSIYQKASDQPLTVHQLIPYHRVLP